MRYLVEGGPVTHIYPFSRPDSAFQLARRFSRNTPNEVFVSTHSKNGSPKIRPVAVFQKGEEIWNEEDE